MRNKLFILIIEKIKYIYPLPEDRYIFIIFIIIFFLFSPSQIDLKKSNNTFLNYIFAESSAVNPQDLKEAYNNYKELEKTYTRWNKGLLKNETYYKKNMTKYLKKIKEKELLTDNDYLLISPEGEYKSGNPRRLFMGKWLEIKGDISEETLSNFFAKNDAKLTRWRRSKQLLSVYGRVTDFKLEYGESGKVVVLYLENIILKEKNNSNAFGKNSK